ARSAAPGGVFERLYQDAATHDGKRREREQRQEREWLAESLHAGLRADVAGAVRRLHNEDTERRREARQLLAEKREAELAEETTFAPTLSPRVLDGTLPQARPGPTMALELGPSWARWRGAAAPGWSASGRFGGAWRKGCCWPGRGRRARSSSTCRSTASTVRPPGTTPLTPASVSTGRPRGAVRGWSGAWPSGPSWSGGRSQSAWPTGRRAARPRPRRGAPSGSTRRPWGARRARGPASRPASWGARGSPTRRSGGAVRRARRAARGGAPPPAARRPARQGSSCSRGKGRRPVSGGPCAGGVPLPGHQAHREVRGPAAAPARQPLQVPGRCQALGGRVPGPPTGRTGRRKVRRAHRGPRKLLLLERGRHAARAAPGGLAV
ncbi:unnamed protein product, partial [Prorocentrum cordatum]